MNRDLPRILLICGVLSSLLYIAKDVGMSVAYQGYSYLHQTVSELNAIGAPTRGLSIGLGFAENVLVIAFGVGIWLASTPWVGLIERVSFYSWHVWFIVLAIVLLRRA